MSTGSTAIYDWKLGDVALARVSQKTYARVRVVKDEKGLFYDDKVLGISGNEDGSITVTKELCYYVETCRTNHKFWLPYTSLHLAERSRPFYGTEKVPQKVKTEVANKTPAIPRKRKVKEDIVVPIYVNLANYKESNVNEAFDSRYIAGSSGECDNAFRAFVRRGKDMFFDQYFEMMKQNEKENRDILHYLLNVDVSTEAKFEAVIREHMTEKEIENYLHECWRYNILRNLPPEKKGKKSTGGEDKDVVTVHTPWCLVCGAGEKLRNCTNCPASFHLACRREWLLTIRHRKNPPKRVSKSVTFIQKILSSTRVISKKSSAEKEKNDHILDICPSCMWGPRVGYDDIVWNKLGTCSWWPARIIAPGEVPSCLLSRSHSSRDWPLKYYGTLNHSWGSPSRTCLFLPTHTGALEAKNADLKQAVMDACDDYIVVYLQ